MLAIVADLLTFYRVIAAGILVWLGASRGARSLSAAALVTILAWISDQLDGWVARRAVSPTRLGRYDFAVDVVFYAGILTYLALAGFVPPWLALTLLALMGGAWLVTRRKAVVILFLRLVDLLCIVIVFNYLPWLGLLVLGWLAASALVYRRRLAQRIPGWWMELIHPVRPDRNR
jgi:phosphatidylglycerophosphate synthase